MAEVETSAGVNSPRNPGIRQGDRYVLRALAALGTSYEVDDYAKVIQGRRATLLIDYNHTDATSIEWYVEWSHDGTNWFRSSNISASGAVNTVTANNATFSTSGDANLADSFEVLAPYLRVQIKRSGGTAASVGIDVLVLTE